jgi:hypothetical protein
MSDILEAIKDAINPKRREQATVETYDAHKRGPYRDQPPTGDGQPGLSPLTEARNPATAEQSDLSTTAAAQRSGSLTSQTLNTAEQSAQTAAGPSQSPKAATSAGYGAPEGTYGRHRSRIANALDPRVDSDRNGNPSHGLSDYGGAANKPVHKEGVKYGLS